MSDRTHVRRLATAVLYAMAMLVPCTASCEQEDMFPFVIGANADGAATDVSFFLRAPAGCDGFVRTEGEHFVNDRGVVRFNGVNLVGPACFPSHAEAERLAARLSRLGLNMVRLHYFDTWAYGSNFMKAPMPALFKNDPQSSCVVDEAQRDRIEYLVAQFKKRGIYLNVNLHVAQELDARDGIPKTSWANRGADFFYGPLIEKEKAYARDLLSHVNPYTGLALKDDPVVAIVEINNENGMFSTWPNGLLDGGEKFGREYQDEFRRQWQAFSGSNKDYLRARAPGPAYTQAETNLFFRFLAHVDGAYFAGMRDFLRRELGVRVPISFTQLDYCTPHTLAESDLVDVHLYWTHPSVVNVPKGINIRRGPHRGIEWNFRAESMFACDVYEKTYDEDFVPHRATMRVKGRPFTVSETSSPYPNWYGAEFNPFLRALAAFQDWSGVVTHSWNNDLDPAPRHTTFFFSYAARTDCLAHFPAMAAMFLRGDVAPAAARVDVGESAETYFSRLAAHGLGRAGVHASPARISGGKFRSSEILVRGIGVDLSRDETQVPPLPDAVCAQMDRRIYAGPQMRLDQSDPQHPLFVVTAANTKFFSGFSSMRPFDLGDGVSVEPGTTRLGWCTISLVSLNGRGFGPGSRVLLAATGLSHNGGARFTHLEGSRWTSRDEAFGRGDTVVEGVRARIVLPGGVAVCRALDGDGRPVRDVPVRSEGGKTVIDIGPEFRTVWYEIDRAAQISLVGNARTFDFSAGKWNRSEFFEVRNDDWDRGAPIVQMPDCIMNANKPEWSDEELFKNHQAEVYSSLVLTNRFRGDITFSSRMSFDHRMAPSLVIAGEFAKDAQGRMAFRDIYEIVLFEGGLNVWRHRRPNGGKSEIEKVAYTAHAFRKKTPYVLNVELKRKRAHGGRLTTDVKVSSDGAEVGFRDETVPSVYSIGLLGSEGRCRFYDLTVDDAALAESVRPVGNLSFGKPFTRGAVLQRDRPVPVWGRAQPGADVRVTYGGLSAKGKADASGAWRVKLPALPASPVSRTLSVSTSTMTLNVDDVVVGEVWLCAGQSNMAMALVDPYTTRYRDGIGSMVAQVADQPLVRYLETPVPTGGWRRFTPEFLSSGRRSSIAVHYALELHEKLGVPVGVVVAAAGGCNIDAYLPMVKSSSDLDAYFLSKVYPYAIRGALWYQGETNLYLGEVKEYGPKMRLLYDRWREMFENPKLSFYYVQLAPFARGNNVVHKQKDGTTRVVDYDNRFPRFLCEQAAFEKEEPNAAMTVINDLGCVGDIHPNEKWLVAKRLALHALKRDYAFANVEDCSPEPVGATAVSNVVTVSFAHAKRMYAYQRGKRFSPDLPFELAGVDGVWRPARVMNFLKGKSMADGTITNNVVVLSAAGVTEPAAVRYAWKLPWTGSLYNEVDLPLGTFERQVDR